MTTLWTWESRRERDLRDRVRQLEGELATSREREYQLVDKIVLLAGLNPLQKRDVDDLSAEPGTPRTTAAPDAAEIGPGGRRAPSRLIERQQRALERARRAREAEPEEKSA